METNVIDLRTRKPLLSTQIRGVVMAQYLDSISSSHNAEEFVERLERQLIAAGSTLIINTIYDLFTKEQK